MKRRTVRVPKVGDLTRARGPAWLRWGAPGNWRALLKCGGSCGTSNTLAGFTVEPDGTVREEFSCPIRMCHWTANLKLEGWVSGKAH